MIPRRLSVWTSAFCLCGLVGLAADWETNFEKAKSTAEREGKFVLADFSGSDWCGWCKKLDQEVFSESAFRKYAKANLVLLLVDFPRGKKLSKKETAQNQALAEEYKVRGYPTVLLLLPDGEAVARTGYQDGGAEKYVEHLDELLAPHRERLPKPAGDAKASKSKRPSSSSILGKGSTKSKSKSGADAKAAEDAGKRQDAGE